MDKESLKIINRLLLETTKELLAKAKQDKVCYVDLNIKYENSQKEISRLAKMVEDCKKQIFELNKGNKKELTMEKIERILKIEHLLQSFARTKKDDIIAYINACHSPEIAKKIIELVDNGLLKL